MPLQENPVGEVVDLFCGAGGLSHGFFLAGFKIIAGYDLDSRCKFAFEENNKATFFCRDVSTITAEEIRKHYSGNTTTVLAGCAPCQPFSSYKRRYGEDPKWNLVTTFARLAATVRPDFVTMENVPALLKYKNGQVFSDFKDILNDAGFIVRSCVVKCEEFGVPQRRRRLVVLAGRDRQMGELKPTHDGSSTVRQAIGNLPSLSAGHADPDDPLHVSPSLEPINLRRIRASKQGGTWRDWPKELVANCHRRPSGKTYPGVYARMSWDKPAPTMTTQCYGFGNGRFGHPEQDRAISLREAAILQSFPNNYIFLPSNEKPAFSEVGRWVGNAVPVVLAKHIGSFLAAHS